MADRVGGAHDGETPQNPVSRNDRLFEMLVHPGGEQVCSRRFQKIEQVPGSAARLWRGRTEERSGEGLVHGGRPGSKFGVRMLSMSEQVDQKRPGCLLP